MVSFPKFEEELKCDKTLISQGKIDAMRCMVEGPRESSSGKHWDVYIQAKDYDSAGNNVRVRVKDGKVAFINCNCEQFSPSVIL